MSNNTPPRRYQAIAPAPINTALIPRDNSQYAIQLHGTPFATFDDALLYIEQQPEIDRYPLQHALLMALMERKEQYERYIAQLGQYARNTEAWRKHVDQDEFEDTWSETRAIETKVERDRLEMEKIKQGLAKKMGSSIAADQLFECVNSVHMAKQLRQYAEHGMTLEQAIDGLNRALVHRLQNPPKNQGDQTKRLTGGDVSRLISKAVTPRKVNEDEAKALGLTFNDRGFLIEAPRVIEQEVSAPRSGSPRISSPTYRQREDPRTPTRGPISSLPRSMSGLSLSSPLSPPPASPIVQGASPRRIPSSPSNVQTPRMPDGRVGHTRRSSQLSRVQNVGGVDDGPEKSGASPGQSYRRISGTSARANPDLDELMELDDSPDPDSPKGNNRRCGCKGISETNMKKFRDLDKSTEAQAVSLLTVIVPGTKRGMTVCYNHTKHLASAFGLQTRKDARTLGSRLEHLYDHRLNIGAVRASKSTYEWFRLHSRPAQPEDALGIFKFAHTNPVPKLATMTSHNWGALIRACGLESSFGKPADRVKEWKDTGSIVIEGLFNWWGNDIEYASEKGIQSRPSIARGVRLEYDMYEFHQRRIGGRGNKGWLRNMYHSLGQQLMRQDPTYYLWYVFLRPDHNWRLISYPYYAKYARKGDHTEFRHIDINIPRYISEGRGENAIQGTLTCTNEKRGQCTIILPGMHRAGKLAAWWEDIKEAGLATDEYVHRIGTKMWTKEHAKKYDTNWTDVPCSAGSVRITMPALPHGSPGPAKEDRRTMLPWYVGIQDDHESLELIEGGTWSELSAAHRDLLPGPASPSGLRNKYSTVPFRFPATIQLTGLGPISDALVGRTRWDNPEVIELLDKLISDPMELSKYVAKWRKDAALAYATQIRRIERYERKAYGENSYFYCLEHGIDPSSVASHPVPEHVQQAMDEEEGNVSAGEEEHGDHY